jgi:hypothetical protein
MSYHRKHEIAPADRKEEKKILTRESIEKGSKTSSSEKNRLMGTKKKKTKK